MTHYIDLHLHSRFARATSKSLTVSELSTWGRRKGISLLATADWTHPMWLAELRDHLNEVAPGTFTAEVGGPRFILGTEISCIYTHLGRVRRVHHLVFVSSFEAADRFIAALEVRGANLRSDGRPIIGLSSRELLAVLLDVDSQAFLIPAHIWTPWFAVFGSKSGYDSLAEAFGDLADEITAVETGLSADPAMHWAVPELQNRRIVSFSDAHSAPKLAREVTAVTGAEHDLTYANLRAMLRGEAAKLVLAHTVEYFAEEGKYSWTGHRACGIRQSPQEDLVRGVVCPVCKLPLTVGVAHRTATLSSGVVAAQGESIPDERGQIFITDPTGVHTPFISTVPLLEILTTLLASPTKAGRKYLDLLNEASELHLLLHALPDELETIAGVDVANAIMRVRRREVSIEPGYDGVFGIVHV